MSKETKNEVKQEETNYEELYVKEKIRAAYPEDIVNCKLNLLKCRKS